MTNHFSPTATDPSGTASAGFWDALADHRITLSAVRTVATSRSILAPSLRCLLELPTLLWKPATNRTVAVHGFGHVERGTGQRGPAGYRHRRTRRGGCASSAESKGRTPTSEWRCGWHQISRLQDGLTPSHFELAAGADDRESAAR